MRIFLAGIMQGSFLGPALHVQDYRTHLRGLMETHLPGVRVYDPLADHGNSLSYDDGLGREVFLRHNQMCSEVEVVLAFVPEASMGTAIEMWEAHRHGKIVIAISPMILNWTVKFLSDLLYETVEEFERELTSGRLAERLQGVAPRISGGAPPAIRGDSSDT